MSNSRHAPEAALLHTRMSEAASPAASNITIVPTRDRAPRDAPPHEVICDPDAGFYDCERMYPHIMNTRNLE